MSALLGLAMWSVAAASEGDLYDPAAPPGSAFVRFVNTGAAAAPATVAGRAVGSVGPAETSAYFVVAPGAQVAALGGAKSSFTPVAGTYYTVHAAGNVAQVITDPANPHLAKAWISVYNLSGVDGAALRTGDGTVTLVDGVAAGAVGGRAVNALTVDLAAHLGGAEVGRFPGARLEQGKAVSVVVLPGNPPKAVWVANRTDTRR